MQILTQQQEALLKDERNLLNDLRVALVQIGTAPEDQETLADSIKQLEEIFLLVIVGEFNAGKSAFINALLGQKLLREGVTPTTTQINVLHYGEEQERQVVNENLHILTLPAPLLSEISIVDTPGTNAVIREHEQITSEFVPRSDLVLFITSADRPFTESENTFLRQIRDWGKKVVIVVNKIDILQDQEELDQILRFVEENARDLLGITPEVFPVSSRLALRAKLGEPNLWPASKFGDLENYIRDTLDEKSRIQLKLLNPLGVGRHLVNRYLSLTAGRLDLLKDDFAMLEDVDSQLAVYQSDMLRDFEYRMADIENILFEMEQRGDEFFEDTFRIARVLDLLNKSRIQKDFERIVVADVPQQIERKVNEMIDWLVESNLRQWQAVNDHLADRRREHQSRIVGDNVGTFSYDRERLIDAVGQEARHVVESFNKDREARLIAEGAQEAVAASAALEVGAIGLGALITALASTVAIDVTGVLLASLLAAVGLFVIPARRRQAKIEMNAKVTDLREKLAKSLRGQFKREIERSLHDINEAIAPYTRFVRAERTKLEETQTRLEEIRADMDRLQARIEDI
ncbi:MAG: GTP-binding protein [Chloroflexi bacterium]|nr:GTP-binding protein [Chloroflexota bacterium]